MRITVATAAIMVAAALGAAAAGGGPVLARPGDGVVEWGEWLDQHGRSAVVVWASWSPAAASTLAELERLTAACRELGLQLVLVAVQEPVEEARRGLEGQEVTWLHDRHGGLLKRYRLIKVPTLVVVEVDGRLAAELEVSAGALRRWGAR